MKDFIRRRLIFDVLDQKGLKIGEGVLEESGTKVDLSIYPSAGITYEDGKSEFSIGKGLKGPIFVSSKDKENMDDFIAHHILERIGAKNWQASSPDEVVSVPKQYEKAFDWYQAFSS